MKTRECYSRVIPRQARLVLYTQTRYMFRGCSASETVAVVLVYTRLQACRGLSGDPVCSRDLDLWYEWCDGIVDRSSE